MDEIRTEEINVTEEMVTEDGMEKKFDIEGAIGTGIIAVAAIGAFEGGKFLVKKGKEPAKKLWGKVTGVFKKKDAPEMVVVSEPNHEVAVEEVKEKTEAKKSEKSKK